MVQNLCSQLIQPTAELKLRLILAEEFWAGLIQAAAQLRRESVRINALVRFPRLAEAVNDCCTCLHMLCFQLHTRPSRLLHTLAHALFSITYLTVTAERCTLHRGENDLLHERAGSFVHFLHLIHRRNIFFNPLD